MKQIKLQQSTLDFLYNLPDEEIIKIQEYFYTNYDRTMSGDYKSNIFHYANRVGKIEFGKEFFDVFLSFNEIGFDSIYSGGEIILPDSFSFKIIKDRIIFDFNDDNISAKDFPVKYREQANSFLKIKSFT